MGPWGDFVFAYTVSLGSQSGMNVAAGLNSWLDTSQIGQHFAHFCAGGVIVAIPVMVLFLFLQKYYVEGVTGGAVKG
jgi:arabinogalactan oligomer/maltooligosaccharide transport system permease protein